MKWYEKPEVTLVPLTAVRTLQLSGDHEPGLGDEIPEDDETELM